MEALEVIGLVGNIITFVDFGSKIMEIIMETHWSTSGTTEENDELAHLTQTMHNLTIDLTPKSPQVPSSAAVIGLMDLTAQCKGLSEEILNLLQKLKSAKPGSKRESLKAAWRNIWYWGEKIDLTKRLDRCQKQLNIQLVHMSRSENGRYFHDLFNQGLATNQQLRALIASTELLRSGVKTVELSSTALEQIQSLLTLSDQATGSEIRHEILKSTAVENMNARFDSVEMAHEKTFSWLLVPEQTRRSETSEEKHARENLVNWFLRGGGIFHISGKPGSGKSTLMKFLYESPVTNSHLRTWAGSKTLVMTNFFFWALCDPKQRSMNGLTRSLLHAALLKVPELIHRLFPDQWNSAKQRKPFHITDRDIATAFDSLTQTRKIFEKYKFIFFIDGLDEYEGNPDIMVKKLFQWTQSNPLDVKICVASRELLVFQERFAQCERLRIHLITRRDTEAYVKAMLKDNEDFKSSQNKEKILEIADTIVDKADGVFLWVKVVIRGLLEGLLAEDRLEDLEQKVKELPRELDDLYQDLFDKMLGHSFPSDRTRAMRTLLLMVTPFYDRSHPLYLIYYSFLDEAEDVDFGFTWIQKGVSNDEIVQRLRKSRKQLSRRCFGLLEVVSHKRVKHFLFDDKIHPIHYTVDEFLSKYRVKMLIQEECKDFDACNFILQGFFASVIMSQQHLDGILNFDRTLEGLLYEYMILAKGKIHSRLLNRFVEYSKHSGSVTKVRVLPYKDEEEDEFIFIEKPLAEATVLIAARLGIYEVSLGTNDGIVPIDTLYWLPKPNPVEMLAAATSNAFAVFRYLPNRKFDQDAPKRLLSAMAYMLKNGASPNACLRDGDISIWMHLMSAFSIRRYDNTLEPVIRLFLLYGADPDMFLCLTSINKRQTKYKVTLQLVRRKMRNTLKQKVERNPDYVDLNKPLESIIQMSKDCGWKIPLRDWITLFCPPNRVNTLQLLIDRNFERNGPPTEEEVAGLKSDECLGLDFDRGVGFEVSSPMISSGIGWLR